MFVAWNFFSIISTMFLLFFSLNVFISCHLVHYHNEIHCNVLQQRHISPKRLLEKTTHCIEGGRNEVDKNEKRL